MEIGERIKAVRKQFKLTQAEFGERIGVKGNTIATYEIGRNAPVDAIFSLLCREYGVNEIWLRSGEGEMFKAMTENEELAAYAGDVLAAAPDDIRKRFLAAQAKWTPDMWAVFAKIVDSFTEAKKPDTE